MACKDCGKTTFEKKRIIEEEVKREGEVIGEEGVEEQVAPVMEVESKKVEEEHNEESGNKSKKN